MYFSHKHFYVYKLHVLQPYTFPRKYTLRSSAIHVAVSIQFTLFSHASHNYSYIRFPYEHCVEWWNTRTFKSDSSIQINNLYLIWLQRILLVFKGCRPLLVLKVLSETHQSSLCCSALVCEPNKTVNPLEFCAKYCL